jgi:hypothetical protein
MTFLAYSALLALDPAGVVKLPLILAGGGDMHFRCLRHAA